MVKICFERIGSSEIATAESFNLIPHILALKKVKKNVNNKWGKLESFFFKFNKRQVVRYYNFGLPSSFPSLSSLHFF